MKKRIFLCLILALVLVLAGCRKKPQETHPSEEGAQSVETTGMQNGPMEDSIFDDDGNTVVESRPAGDREEDKDSAAEGNDATKPTDGKDNSKEPTESTRPGSNPPDTDGPVDPPAPDDPDPGKPGNQEPDPTENPGGSGNVNVPDVEDVDYRTFMDMSPSEQQAFMESFDSIEDFFVWYEAAKKKYEEENPPIDVGDGNVTIPG